MHRSSLQDKKPDENTKEGKRGKQSTYGQNEEEI